MKTKITDTIPKIKPKSKSITSSSNSADSVFKISKKKTTNSHTLKTPAKIDANVQIS